MRIKYIRAKNFLSIGNEGIEIDFTKYGNIINVKGDNRDQGQGASNGCGKTSIVEILVYSLYGELMKGLNHKQAINIKTEKGLEAEIVFESENHEYRVIRKRKPDGLELWKDGVNESKGGIPATQEEINQIIRMNYTAFINIVCFGQHNNKQFLGCSASDKRNIAENLLSLDMYNKYSKISKEKLKGLQDKLKYLNTVYDKSLQDLSFGERQVKQIFKQQDEWKTAQINAIERFKAQREKTKTEIVKLSNATPNNNYEKLQAVKDQIEQEQANKAKYSENSTLAYEKIVKIKEESQGHLLSLKETQYTSAKVQKEIDSLKNHSHSLQSQEGATCNVCFGIINPANFKSVLEYNDKRISELQEELKIHEYNKNAYQTQRTKLEEYLLRLKTVYENLKSQEMVSIKVLKDLEQKKSILNSTFREDANSGVLLLEQQIEHLTEQIEQKQKESDPYTEVLEVTKAELEKNKIISNNYKDEIVNLEKQQPYYEFWIKAFGDNGIRSFVLGEVIPILNARINYWLQFLVDNKIQLNFNEKLEETIERNPKDGDPFVYNAMSGGEHQRIDLGIALAFAQVMMLTAGTVPSLVCLDEVGTNLDRPGIQAVYNTICELATERQVLVITHDPDLQEMLGGYETIQVVKEDGFTRIEK